MLVHVSICVLLHSAVSLLVGLLLVIFALQTLQLPKLAFSYVSDIDQRRHWREVLPGFCYGSLKHEVFILLCDIMIYKVV